MDIAFFSKGGSFRNNDKQSLSRILINPKISHVFTKNNYFLKTSLFFKYSYKEFNNLTKKDFLPTLNLNQSLKFFKKSKKSKYFLEPFLNLKISDQKKIVNNLKVDSGLKLSSINEEQIFGNMFMSYQKDINLGTKLSFYESNLKKIQVKISKLYSIGKKSIFYENLKIDFPEPFSLEIDYKTNQELSFISKISIDNENNFSSYNNSFKFDSNNYKFSLRHHLIKNIQVFNLAENSQNKKEINSLELTAALNFSKSWSGGFKVISDIEHKKNITNIFSIDYENDGLILGIAYMKSLEPDWISILENNSFKDYHRDRIRLFFELKGLGSIGRPKDNYLKRRSL